MQVHIISVVHIIYRLAINKLNSLKYLITILFAGIAKGEETVKPYLERIR